MMTFPAFLEKQYLSWQNNQGRRKTIAEFANYLGTQQGTLSMWMTGARKPDAENTRRLANILGMEVYDALGMERPDPDLAYLTQHWDDLPPALRRALREQAEQQRENEPKRLSKTRRTGTAG